MNNSKKVKIIYKDGTEEEFYEKFIKHLEKEEYFKLENCIIKGDVDIKDIYDRIKDNGKLKELIKEEDNIIYVKINISINIENVEFKDKFIIQSFLTNYIHKRPIPSFKYIRTIFNGNVRFYNVLFSNEANFKDAIFDRKVDFRGSEFCGKADFENTLFNKYLELNSGYAGSYYTDFSGVIFNNLCNFNNAIFYGNADFSDTYINKNRKQTKFLDEASFNVAKFFGEVEFHAIFGKEEDKDTFKNVNFRGAEFHKKTSFNNSKFYIKASFGECKFKGEIYFQFRMFKSGVIFYKSIFDGHVEFRCVFESLVLFEETEFNHSVNFWNTKFSEAIFKMTKFNNVSFIYSEFNMNLTFLECEFKNAEFYGTKFKSVYFEFCKCEGIFAFYNEHPAIKKEGMKTVFNGDLYIEYCSFDGAFGFIGTEFKKNVEILECGFKKTVQFENVEFKKDRAEFKNLTFKGNAYFKNTIFENIYFEGIIFEENADFSNSIFNVAKFSNSTFKSRAYFENIKFNLLSFLECGFRDTAVFKKLDDGNFEGLAVFYHIRFDEHTTIDNFSLSKTSFLRTDIREAMILFDIEKDEILSHKLLKSKENTDGMHKVAYEILKNYIDYRPVLAEYRNLRLSIENNITYEEASDLYKMEMKFRKEFSYNEFEKFIIRLYGAISDYGESIFKPFGEMMFFIFMFPIPFLVLEYNAKGYLEHNYIDCLLETLRAFFQLGIKEDSLMYHYEWLIRIISLILLGNIFIAIKRRLERK